MEKIKDVLKKYAEGEDIMSVVANDALDNDGYEVGYLSDVIQHGCVSGTCSGLIYYSDTVAFYDKHKDEIEKLIFDTMADMGEDNRFAFIATLRGSEHVGSIDQEKNLLTWFAYETIADRLYNELYV